MYYRKDKNELFYAPSKTLYKSQLNFLKITPTLSTDHVFNKPDSFSPEAVARMQEAEDKAELLRQQLETF